MDRRDGMSPPPSSLQQHQHQQQQQQQHHPQQHQHHHQQQQQQQQQHHPFLVQQQRPIPPPPPQHHIHLASPPPGLHVPSVVRPTSGSMGSPVPSPGGGAGSAGVGALVVHDGFVPQQLASGVRAGEPVKRKRGRPRKYGDSGATPSGVGGSVSLALTPLSSVNPMASPGTPTEKRRGRPPGSGKKQQLAALGSAGQGFTPHVITIAAGEDVATKIMSFSQTGPRAVCVLSANGAISNVTLRQPATSGGTVTYEGRFEILSLSGSFLLTESGGTRSRTGGLSVSLAGPDGRVVGGGVAGLLMAASPVQVVVGSFIAGSNKSMASRPLEGLASPPGSGGGGMQRPKNESSGPSSPHMEQQGSGGSGSSLMHSHSQVQAMGSLQSLGWSSSQSLSEPRRDTDINIPLPNG